MFFLIICGIGFPIKFPLSGYVVDKDTGLPIDGVVVIRSWDKVVYGPAGSFSTLFKHEEVLTDAYGRYRFSVTFIPYVGIPVLSGIEENNLIAYKAGYNFTTLPPGSREIHMEKTSETYYRRYEEYEKARGNYSVEYYETTQLKEVIDLEELLIKKLSRYAKGLFYVGSVADIDFDDQGNVIISSGGKLYTHEFSADGKLGRKLNVSVISTCCAVDIEPDGNGNIMAFSRTAAVKIEKNMTETQPGYPGTPLVPGDQMHNLFENYDPRIVVIPGKGFYALLSQKSELRGFDFAANEICSYRFDRNQGRAVDIAKGSGETIIMSLDSTYGTTALFLDQKCKIIDSKVVKPAGLHIRTLTSSGDGTLFMATNDGVYSADGDFTLSKIVGIPEASWGETYVTQIKVDRSAENLFIFDGRYSRTFLYDLKQHRWNESGAELYDTYGKFKATVTIPALPLVSPTQAMPAISPSGGMPQQMDRYSAELKKFREIGARDPHALIKALSNNDALIRRAAATTLGQIGGGQAVIPLLKALRDTDISVKSAVIDSLGRIEDPRAVDDLIHELTNRDNHYAIRAHAAQALGNIQAQKAEKVLLDCLGEPVSGGGIYPALFRMYTIRALGQLKSEAATQQILTVLRSTEDQEIQDEAITALGEIGDRRANPYLLQLLESWPKLNLDLGNNIHIASDKDRRFKIIIALRKIADPASLPALSALAGDANYLVIKETVKALVAFGGPEIVEPLCIAIRNSNDTETKERASNAIIGFGQAAISPLTKLLDDKDPKIREIAARILGETDNVSSVPGLIKALRDNDKSVRNTAAHSLGKLGDPSAVDALESAAKDPTLISSALYALAKIGAPSGEAIVRILDKNEVKIQVDAAALLVDIGGPSVAPLKKYLREDDIVLRTLATWVYVQIGKRSPEVIASVIKGEDDVVRARLVEIIGDTGAADTVDMLLGLAVSERSPLVRARAIEALGKIKDPRSRHVLTEATRHKSPLVKKAAAWALRQLEL